MNFYKAIPPFWKKTLATVGLLAVALTAVLYVFYGNLKDRASTKKQDIMESKNTADTRKGQNASDIYKESPIDESEDEYHEPDAAEAHE